MNHVQSSQLCLKMGLAVLIVLNFTPALASDASERVEQVTTAQSDEAVPAAALRPVSSVVSAPVSSLVSAPVAPQTDLTTVEELLRLDTHAALAAARRNVFRDTTGESSVRNLSLRPAVQAIYGFGRQFTAEILIEGNVHIFKSSQKQPLSSVASGYQLERINPPCVYLLHAQKQEVLCLEVAPR